MRKAGWRRGAAAAAVIVAGVAIWYFAIGTTDTTHVRLDPDNARLVAAGEAIYQDHCASCHGVTLEGQQNWRSPQANGRLRAPPHDETGHTWHHPDILLFEITKRGPAAVAGNGYQSDMSGYDGILTDDEIIAALSFIKSQWPPEIRQRHDDMNARAGR